MNKMTKKIIHTFFIFCVMSYSTTFAAEPKSIGKFKNWETFTYNDGKGKVCFAQTLPLERGPKNFKRGQSRLFVTLEHLRK